MPAPRPPATSPPASPAAHRWPRRPRPVRLRPVRLRPVRLRPVRLRPARRLTRPSSTSARPPSAQQPPRRSPRHRQATPLRAARPPETPPRPARTALPAATRFPADSSACRRSSGDSNGGDSVRRSWPSPDARRSPSPPPPSRSGYGMPAPMFSPRRSAPPAQAASPPPAQEARARSSPSGSEGGTDPVGVLVVLEGIHPRHVAAAARSRLGPAGHRHVLLNVIGLVMVLSASSVDALRSTARRGCSSSARSSGWRWARGPDDHRPLDYRRWARLAWPLVVAVAVLLLAVLVPGVGISVNGSTRWLGFGLLRVQPSELAKLALLVFTADLLARRSRPHPRRPAHPAPRAGHGRRARGTDHGPARHGHHPGARAHRGHRCCSWPASPSQDGRRDRRLDASAPSSSAMARRLPPGPDAGVPRPVGRRLQHRLPGRPVAGRAGHRAASPASAWAPAGPSGASCPTPTPTSSSPSSARSSA